ncbi:conserved hypothetical protein [Pediculus humanus corporis]|uniref:Mitogen-activated protein kinase kinase kinase n=1 Tax=Pediculus humanus subsp. corporis TaxID=121224 RepID=E0VDU3_PEDHC|nr:uncharacterized protein Phum_PHUM125400 [Pediculus humanus corporis]EEB11549.1 conserved hypothetical protein [Pediculus humanus corporis]
MDEKIDVDEDLSDGRSANVNSSKQQNSKPEDYRHNVFMESKLQPIPPDTSSEESVKIYEEHKEMAKEYMEVQAEMSYLSRYLKKLEEKLNKTEEQRQQIQQLVSEKESLEQLQKNLTKQLELLQKQRQGNWMFSNSQDPRLT